MTNQNDQNHQNQENQLNDPPQDQVQVAPPSVNADQAGRAPADPVGAAQAQQASQEPAQQAQAQGQAENPQAGQQPSGGDQGGVPQNVSAQARDRMGGNQSPPNQTATTGPTTAQADPATQNAAAQGTVMGGAGDSPQGGEGQDQDQGQTSDSNATSVAEDGQEVDPAAPAENLDQPEALRPEEMAEQAIRGGNPYPAAVSRSRPESTPHVSAGGSTGENSGSVDATGAGYGNTDNKNG